MNFAGQPCAKLTRNQPIYEGAATRHSALITIFSPLLFFAPHYHLTELEKAWVDEMMSFIDWKALTSKLTDEWKEFILYSTVMRKS
jgi:hypothetical protein